MKHLATPPSLAPEVALDLARLTDTLRIVEGGFVGFALFDTFPVRDAMIDEIEMRLAGEVEIRRVELTPERPYLYERLELDRPSAISHQLSARHIAYFVYGFEGISDEARAQAFGALQIQREAIGRLEVPVVLWMVEGNLIDLARRAPDFFRWRGGLYDFRSPDRARAEEFDRAITKMLGEYAPSLVPPDELRKRVRLFEELLARRQAEPEPHFGRIAGLHHDLGILYTQLSEWDTALAHFQQACEIRERLDDEVGLAMTLGNIGNIFNNKGEWDTALVYYQQARETFDRLGDADGLAMTLGNIGNIFNDKGERDAALVYYQQARETFDRLGDAAGLAMTLGNIGNIFNNKGERDAALVYYQQARETFDQLGDAAGLAMTLGNIGSVFNNKGEWDAALAYYQQARETFERLGDAGDLARTLWNIGLIYEAQGRLTDAQPLLERAVELERRFGHPDAEKDAAYLTSLRQRQGSVTK